METEKNIQVQSKEKRKVKVEQSTKSKRINDNIKIKDKDAKEKIEDKLIAIIRIAGMVKKKPIIRETLDRLRLRRKYSCVLVKPNKDNLGMIKKVKFYVSYGNIEKNILIKLLKQRGKKIDKTKFDAENIADELLKRKSLKELGFKPFFRLHPPRGGIKSKLQYPKGVLGHNKDINKLIERML